MIWLFGIQDAGWEQNVSDSEAGVGFFRNTIVRTLIAAALLPIFASFGVLSYFIRPTETLLVLHYNVYFGVDLLGVWWQAYILPALSALFFGGHLFLAQHFYRRTERIAAYLLLLASGLIGFSVLIASIGISFINY